MQNATDTGQGSLVFFLFDLLHLDGEDLTGLPVIDRKARLKTLLADAPSSLQYNDQQIGQGPASHGWPANKVSKVSSRNASVRHTAMAA